MAEQADPLQLLLHISLDKRPAVARRIVRLTRPHRPRWTRVEDSAAAGSTINVPCEAGHNLRGGNEEKFISAISAVLETPHRPVARKRIIARAPSPLKGLLAYERRSMQRASASSDAILRCAG